MIKIKLNSLIFPYFISLYNSIHDFERSINCTLNWCVIGPLETVQKRASTLFPQVKNHQLLCARQYN